MEPRWSPPIPQAMQRHGGPPKNAPMPEAAKHALEVLDESEPRHGAPTCPQDQRLGPSTH